MIEAAVIAPKVPAAPPSERGAKQIRESLETGIRQKASSPHLMVNNKITKDGRAIAADIYQKESQFGVNTGQFVEAAKGIRQKINEELSGYRKDAKTAVLKALEAEGKTRRQVGKEEFKQRVKNQTAGDSHVQEAQVMRKLLSSIVQRAKSADVSEIRLKLKGEVTEAEIDARLQELQKLRAEGKIKRVPGRELIRNAITEQKRKALPVSKPSAEIAAIREQHDSRATLLVQRAKSRTDRLRSSIMASVAREVLKRGQYGVGVIRDTAVGIGENVVRRPLAAAAATLAIAGVLGLQNPQAVGADIATVSRQIDVSAVTSSGNHAPLSTILSEYGNPGTGQPPVLERTVAPPVTIAHAEFAVRAPTLYLPDGRKVTELPKGSMQIHKLSDAKGEYMVEVTFPDSSNPAQAYKVPIDQIDNVEGELDKEAAFQHPFYEVRNDKKDLMGEVVKSGASGVRIEAQDWDITTDDNLRAKLEEAKKHNLRILYVFNPTKSLSDAEIKQLLKPVIQSYGQNDKLEIEIGNEVDNDTVAFWPDFYEKFNASDGRVVDFESFAKQAARTIKVINEIDKELGKNKPTPKVIGALVDPDGKQIPYANNIRQESKNLGVDIDDPSILWGNHTYQEVADVLRRIQALIRAGIPPNKQRFTEIGVIGKTKLELLKMVKIVMQQTGNRVTVHELPNENPLEEDMGFVQRKDPNKPTEVTRNASFYQVLKLLKDMSLGN